ncbi:hypothetical protein RRG08_027991 [Elysia crispata]|uniref:Uncharacterized protein n=1 Tax=Elysia crispata TaxID=231223 RepID=A0AAE1ECZ8_9GAST|nr:hypothetical protein RRG08_027991 [Elysia crispata]
MIAFSVLFSMTAQKPKVTLEKRKGQGIYSDKSFPLWPAVKTKPGQTICRGHSIDDRNEIVASLERTGRVTV